MCVPRQELFLIHKAKVCQARSLNSLSWLLSLGWLSLEQPQLGFSWSMSFCAVSPPAPPDVCVGPRGPPSGPVHHKLMSDLLLLSSTSPRCSWDPGSLWETAKGLASSGHLDASLTAPQGHAAMEGWSWDQDPGSLTPPPPPLATMSCFPLPFPRCLARRQELRLLPLTAHCTRQQSITPAWTVPGPCCPLYPHPQWTDGDERKHQGLGIHAL